MAQVHKHILTFTVINIFCLKEITLEQMQKNYFASGIDDCSSKFHKLHAANILKHHLHSAWF